MAFFAISSSSRVAIFFVPRAPRARMRDPNRASAKAPRSDATTTTTHTANASSSESTAGKCAQKSNPPDPLDDDPAPIPAAEMHEARAWDQTVPDEHLDSGRGILPARSAARNLPGGFSSSGRSRLQTRSSSASAL